MSTKDYTAEDFEEFLKRARDRHVERTIMWIALNDALEEYRDHCVTGSPLNLDREEFMS